MKSPFGELAIPIFSDEKAAPGLQALTLSREMLMPYVAGAVPMVHFLEVEAA